MIPKLTIGMATYKDFDGVYFSIQALRLFQDMEDTEILVVDNYGCSATRNFVEAWAGSRYIEAKDKVGTAAPRNLVMEEAKGEAVLCMDCHVLLALGVVKRLKSFYRENPHCYDLLQGPLIYDDLKSLATHFAPIWNCQMWGMWGKDSRGEDPDAVPFDIPMQGLGIFSCRRDAWLGFNSRFKGFGGEEGYIHEKFRQAGRRTLCLPFLRWLHRFGRPGGVPFPVSVEDKFRNYLIGHDELGLDFTPIFKHFDQYLERSTMDALAYEVLGVPHNVEY
jgi:glycosyltransferase involved in cell wall biosynthesis